ncbi:MAG TPA: helix-turn-helix domain-containing protein [Chlamydiales bacterium]|nr:helix-turn-helix domain-containing protein [Chlamydiales bacterium]
MEIQARVWKDGKFWLVEIPSLDAMTQGKSKADAIRMAKDLVTEMIQSYFKTKGDVKVVVSNQSKDTLCITATEVKLLTALVLRRQREKSGLTVKEAAERLGSKSPNSYAQYERGLISVSIDKYEHLLQAANPFDHRRLRLV